MEQIQNRSGRRLILITLLVGGVLLAALFLLINREHELGSLVASSVPIVEVRAVVQSSDSRTLGAGDLSRVQLVEPPSKSEGAPVTPTPKQQSRKEAGVRSMTVTFTRAPLAFSLQVHRGGEIVEWLATPPVRAFMESELGIGLIAEVERLTRIRGEDLRIEGVRGVFLQPIVDELLSSPSVLHYDYSYGRQGFVWSVERIRVPLLSRLLPALLRATVQERFRIPGLPELYSLQIGHQRLMLAELDGHLFVSLGLRALLNVLEQYPIDLPSDSNDASFTVRVRGEGFLSHLMPLVVGGPQLPLDIPFKAGARLVPLSMRIGPARMWGAVEGTLAPEIIRAIPNDVVGVVAGSFPGPFGISPDQWDSLSRGETLAPSVSLQRGVALLWDVSSVEGEELSQLGVILRSKDNQSLIEAQALFAGPPDAVAQCNEGKLILWASSPKLLARMRQSCESGVPPADGAESAQLLVSVHLAHAVRQLLSYGLRLAHADARVRLPEPSRVSYQAAQEGVGQRAEQSASLLPSLMYMGRIEPSGIILQGAFR